MITDIYEEKLHMSKYNPTVITIVYLKSKKLKTIKSNMKLIKVVKFEKNLFYKDIWCAHQALLENHECSMQLIYGL